MYFEIFAVKLANVSLVFIFLNLVLFSFVISAAVLKKYDADHSGMLETHELHQVVNDIKLTDTGARFAGYTAAFARAVRYLAFTSDFGEAFRPVAHPRLVTATYGISWAYCGADVAWEAYKAHKRGASRDEMFHLVSERSVFQAVASMALPAFSIHTTVNLGQRFFNRIGRFQKWGPTVAGLSLIPFLPVMFDHPVEHLLNKVWMNYSPWRHAVKASNPSDPHAKQH
jgi:fission process protein 1